MLKRTLYNYIIQLCQVNDEIKFEKTEHTANTIIKYGVLKFQLHSVSDDIK